MCHPGFCGEELLRSRTRLKESRRRELDALVSEEVRRAVEETGVELCGFESAGRIGSANSELAR